MTFYKFIYHILRWNAAADDDTVDTYDIDDDKYHDNDCDGNEDDNWWLWWRIMLMIFIFDILDLFWRTCSTTKNPR
jgi:hypothetical protein